MWADHTRPLLWALDLAVVLCIAASLWVLCQYTDLTQAISHIQQRLSVEYGAPIWLPSSLRNVYLPTFHQRMGTLRDDRWIRLCNFTELDDGSIDIFYGVFRLDELPPYRALSYTWGPAHGIPEDADTVLRTDFGGTTAQSTMPKNLLRAIRRLSQINPGMYYWIDFICINQADVRERTEQVNMMHVIYQGAEAVDVWLGDWSPHLERVQGIVADLAGMETEWGSLWRPPKHPNRHAFVSPLGVSILQERDWELLTDFMSRRWFHRLWALQEFALGREVRILCGDDVFDHEELTAAAPFLYSQSHIMKMKYGRSDAAGSAIVQQSLLKDVVNNVTILPSYLPTSISTGNEAGLDYEAVLAWVYWRSAATLATDARDYVYGIVGIANAIMDSWNERFRDSEHLTQSYTAFEADYTMSTEEVFRAFTLRLMHGSPGIRAIALIQPGPEHEFQDRQGDRSYTLPSWIPNLADRDRLPLSNGGAMTMHIPSRPNASVFGNRSIVQRFSQHGHSLHVHGMRIGNITRRMPLLFPYTPEPSACLNYMANLQNIVRELPERHSTTGESPIAVLLSVFAVGDDLGGRNRSAFPIWKLEKLLADMTVFTLWVHMSETANKFMSVDELLITREASAATIDIVRSVPGLPPDFLSRELVNLRRPENVFLWGTWQNDLEFVFRHYKHTAVHAMYDASQTCYELIQRFERVKGSRLFAIQGSALESLQDQARLLGIGPDMADHGDEVWAVQGSEWPFVLRRNRTTGTYRFLGEAYVHGIMRGELFEEDLTLREIVLR